MSNGLRVVANHDLRTSMAAFNLLYNVGARDENPMHTGMAHLFEHLMFGGSANAPDYDAPLEMAGGWSNAWTSNDFTSFYDVVPAENIATPFWLESDRMLALTLDSRALEIQRSVVLEEFKQTCLNKPYGDISHHLRSLVFTKHPYRYPAIGVEPAHIENITLLQVRDFYRTHYSPSNAVLAVSGNVKPERVFTLAQQWFGSIPALPAAPRLYPPEPPVTSPRRKEVAANVPHTRIAIAFPMGAYGSEHYIAADLISDILASGHSSRLYRMVMQSGGALINADSSILGSEEPGFLMLNARIEGGEDRAIMHAEQMLREQICRITDKGVEQRELDRVLNRFESNHTFSSLSYLQKAQNLALAEMHGEDLNDIPARYRATTPEKIRSAAASILDPSRACTLIYRPDRKLASCDRAQV